VTGYIILIVFALFVIGCFASFLGGLVHGKKLAAAEYAEEQRRREKSEKEFREIKSEINQEVFKDAAEKKADLNRGDAIDRFNTINNSLSNNAKN